VLVVIAHAIVLALLTHAGYAVTLSDVGTLAQS
jgi:hypothetical protein